MRRPIPELAVSLPSSAALRNAESLYNHHGWLRGWLARRLDNAFDAGDLAQDTFVRILCAPAAAAEVREPRAYLATIARRLLLNHQRRASLERAYAEQLALMPSVEVPSAEQQVAILQTLQALDTMLAGLPPKVRAVFVLSQIEGLTYAAIADELGVGLRSVKRYAAQALVQCALLEGR
ncbi:sigma-70 family RNA polymerase sigma factor [Verticiella sediminum]|uniref:Sigma-70 family RNA polymerase sigma factor n=1 Tax=Verticiella sediminum TaxID=1247510 RepID=A0A556B0A8_9BURK|nr:sigma-70 family RNA polymerase sigma factor [Verticiella sediminum]